MSFDPPPRFDELDAGRDPSARLWADREFAASLGRLGIARGGLDWIADPTRAPGATPGLTGPGRAPAAVVTLPDRSERILLRALRHGGWWAGLWGARLAGPGRGGRELGAAARLMERGAPVPRPVCLAQRRARPGWQVAVGHLFLEDALDARRWLEGEPGPRAVEGAARAAGRALRRFHDCGGRHRDLHVGNLLLRPGAETPEVWVVDLDGARVGAPPSPARRIRELMRLWRSLRKVRLADRLGARGCAAFYGAYCSGDRALRRGMARRLPIERARTALHATRYG